MVDIEEMLFPKKKSRFPLWVHIILRILLQSAIGYGFYWSWIRGHVLYSLAFGLVFIYLIVILIWGKELSQMIMDYATK